MLLSGPLCLSNQIFFYWNQTVLDYFIAVTNSLRLLSANYHEQAVSDLWIDKHVVIIQFAQHIMQSQLVPSLCSRWVVVFWNCEMCKWNSVQASDRNCGEIVQRVYMQSWKDHCWSVLAWEREVTLVPPLHCVITVGAAALWLFLTGCDTDGFDHRDSQSQGPRKVKGRGLQQADKKEGSFWEREKEGRQIDWDSAHFFLQGWCLKQTENLNKDGSHQLENIFI